MFVEAAALDSREQYHGKAQAHYAKAADLAAKDGDPHRACQLYHQVRAATARRQRPPLHALRALTNLCHTATRGFILDFPASTHVSN